MNRRINKALSSVLINVVVFSIKFALITGLIVAVCFLRGTIDIQFGIVLLAVMLIAH